MTNPLRLLPEAILSLGRLEIDAILTRAAACVVEESVAYLGDGSDKAQTEIQARDETWTSGAS
jgi:hypothetical protein